MQTYRAGNDVTLTVPLVDDNDNAIAPDAISWRLLDELENQILPPEALLIPPDNFVNITVLAAQNTLPAGVKLAARTVELTFVTATDHIYKRVSYGLHPAQRLEVLVNSFQTLTQAELESSLMPGLDGWLTASEDEKIMAMGEAYRRLTRIGYFVRWPRDPDAQNTISWWNVRNTQIPARFWQFMKMDRFMTYYPEDFRAALRKAQVSEADDILNKDQTRELREAGVISEEIGQSRVEFRDAKPLDLGIARRTLRYLDGYVNMRLTLTRS